MASLLFITNGTSYSSPLVAGIAALVISENPSLAPPGQSWGPGAVEWVLRASSVDLGAVGHDNDFGWGLPRADVAVSIAAALAAVGDMVFFDGFETGDVSIWSSVVP
jgi:subtilisin family serine protease